MLQSALSCFGIKPGWKFFASAWPGSWTCSFKMPVTENMLCVRHGAKWVKVLSPVILTGLQGRCHDFHFTDEVTEIHEVKTAAWGPQKQVAGEDSVLSLSTWRDLHTPSLSLNASVPLGFNIILIFILPITWNSLLDVLLFLPPAQTHFVMRLLSLVFFST